jgi:hypothetical protein
MLLMLRSPLLHLLPLLAALWSGAAQAQADAPAAVRYGLKQVDPTTGTHIKRTVVTSGMPLDTPYAGLSPQQQASLREQYVGMDPADEPPYPAEGMGSVIKPLHTAQSRLLVRGKLSLLVDVDSQGKAGAVSVLESPDDDMTRFAAQLLMLVKYKPAVCGGTPCRMQFPLEMIFSIRR